MEFRARATESIAPGWPAPQPAQTPRMPAPRGGTGRREEGGGGGGGRAGRRRAGLGFPGERRSKRDLDTSMREASLSKAPPSPMSFYVTPSSRHARGCNIQPCRVRQDSWRSPFQQEKQAAGSRSRYLAVEGRRCSLAVHRQTQGWSSVGVPPLLPRVCDVSLSMLQKVMLAYDSKCLACATGYHGAGHGACSRCWCLMKGFCHFRPHSPKSCSFRVCSRWVGRLASQIARLASCPQAYP